MAINTLAGAVRAAGVTENGAASNATSGSGLLDLFAHGAALRAREDFDRIVPLFEAAYREDPQYAVACLFYLRDVRGGQGERKIFRLALEWLARNDRRAFERVLPLVSEYGRWDDILMLAEDNPGELFSDAIIDLVAAQLAQDENADHPSLLGKWMPSENSGSKRKPQHQRHPLTTLGWGSFESATYEGLSPRQIHRKRARFWMKALNRDAKSYRYALTALRNRIRIVETLMSQKRWSEINYSAVPSLAMRLYRKAFGKQDKDRFEAFIQAALKGEAKINAKILTPYDVVQKLVGTYGEDAVLDALWNNIPDFLGDKDILPIIDLSSSMNGVPMVMAIAMGLYLAKHNKGQFKNRIITFSADPKFVEVDTSKSLYRQLRTIQSGAYGYNTNLNKVFRMLLTQAKGFDVPPEGMPKYITIVSDMQFDAASGAVRPEIWGGGDFKPEPTNFEAIKKLYADAGYVMPEILFWNVRSSGTDAAVTMDERGVYLVSGQNPVAFEKLIKVDLSAPPTPYEAMMNVLNNDRYLPVMEAINGGE